MSRKTRVILIIAIIISLIASLAVVLIDNDEPEVSEAQDNRDTVYGERRLGIDAGVDEALADYRNIMIYGIDNKSRSDIMLVFSINKNTNKVKLFTIYRDTYLEMNDESILNFGGIEYKYFKCNHGYFKYGMDNSLKTLNRQLDLNIHEAIAMDWDDIAEFVDLCGGIEVNVTEAMIPYMGKFMDDGTEGLQPGHQVLMNKKAVAYLRCRKDADAAVRSHRNEAVFVQMFEKARDMTRAEQMEIFESLAEDVDTNMSRATMIDILDQLSSYEIEVCDGWPYDYSIEWHKTESYYFYVPHTLESNVSELHKVIFDQEDYVPTDEVRRISKVIEAGDDLE